VRSAIKHGQNLNAHPVDRYVGRQILPRRIQLNVSQSALAKKIGLSFQHVQKYETARNRICASMLFEIARVLETPVAALFHEMPDSTSLETSMGSQP
jgi:transcriptional regulator with XRE-family HTH domain